MQKQIDKLKTYTTGDKIYEGDTITIYNNGIKLFSIMISTAYDWHGPYILASITNYAIANFSMNDYIKGKMLIDNTWTNISGPESNLKIDETKDIAFMFGGLANSGQLYIGMTNSSTSFITYAIFNINSYIPYN